MSFFRKQSSHFFPKMKNTNLSLDFFHVLVKIVRVAEVYPSSTLVGLYIHFIGTFEVACILLSELRGCTFFCLTCIKYIQHIQKNIPSSLRQFQNARSYEEAKTIPYKIIIYTKSHSYGHIKLAHSFSRSQKTLSRVAEIHLKTYIVSTMSHTGNAWVQMLLFELQTKICK